jgi:GR25 family glycosyltransferase involved in LPS biosynthesis
MYTIGIVAHESRAEQAKALHTLVQADLPLQLDDDTLGCTANHKRTWAQLAEHNRDWCVVLEDDAQPVPDFTTQLKMALLVAPTDIVSLYLGTGHPRYLQSHIARALTKADHHQAHWITARPAAVHTVALAIRTPLAQTMLTELSDRSIDRAIGTWAKQNRHPIAFTVPSLVDHADTPTINRPTPPNPRKAWRTGQHTRWTHNTVSM